jgi:hypothetical protein
MLEIDKTKSQAYIYTLGHTIVTPYQPSQHFFLFKGFGKYFNCWNRLWEDLFVSKIIKLPGWLSCV